MLGNYLVASGLHRIHSTSDITGDFPQVSIVTSDQEPAARTCCWTSRPLPGVLLAPANPLGRVGQSVFPFANPGVSL